MKGKSSCGFTVGLVISPNYARRQIISMLLKDDYAPLCLEESLGLLCRESNCYNFSILYIIGSNEL